MNQLAMINQSKEQMTRKITFLADLSQQQVAKMRQRWGGPHSFIIPRLDKKGRPVK
jgi:tRNA A37 threonylcarbamoyladenosine synthetase subunit TsaC/SUA5/YrdC